MELVAEAKAEVMEEIEDNREEGEDDDIMELTGVPNLHLFLFSVLILGNFLGRALKCWVFKQT